MSGPRIVVLGAGAIGCFVGGAWSRAVDVTLIARPAIAQAAAHGLRLTDFEGFDAQVQPKITVDPGAMAKADLVILAVKGPATLAAARQIAGSTTRPIPVLSLQNGLAPARDLAAALPGWRIIPGMVAFNVARRAADHWHKGSLGGIIAQDDPLLRQLADRLDDGPAPLSLVSDMQPIQWGKLLLNLNNPINALSGLTLREELSQRPYRGVLAAAMEEALAVMTAAGITPAKVGATSPQMAVRMLRSPDLIFRNIALRMQRIDAHARSSMADDFAANRPTEIDALNGEVVRLAEGHGMAAPVNAAIAKLVRDAETGGKSRFSGAELVSAVGLGR